MYLSRVCIYLMSMMMQFFSLCKNNRIYYYYFLLPAQLMEDNENILRLVYTSYF